MRNCEFLSNIFTCDPCDTDACGTGRKRKHLGRVLIQFPLPKIHKRRREATAHWLRYKPDCPATIKVPGIQSRSPIRVEIESCLREPLRRLVHGKIARRGLTTKSWLEPSVRPSGEYYLIPE